METKVTESGLGQSNEKGTIENRAAVAGLIASNIGFVVLFVGGVVGIVFGIVGLLRTRDPRFRGRGMAICAIVVGVASICTSAFFTYSLTKIAPIP
jgi:hypothetical protein